MTGVQTCALPICFPVTIPALAFKSGGATRNCFGVVITVGTETFTDDYNGALVGSAGGTGTINYITGAYTVSVAGAGTATYQWENSNVKGITDYTKSATRIAGEGFILRQDVGGDAIQTVLIGQDGAYYSLKKNSCYRLELDLEDINPRNRSSICCEHPRCKCNEPGNCKT